MLISCVSCPKCDSLSRTGSSFRRYGYYFRTDDRKWIQRYQCRLCLLTVSSSTFGPWFRQKKRVINAAVMSLLQKGVSVRNVARHQGINRKTVDRKLIALGHHCASELDRINRERGILATECEFDDLETNEHTKCKPLSVTLAVETKPEPRLILGLEVSAMPAKGKLAERAKKYGARQDERAQGRRRLFERLKELVAEDAVIKSDANPHYAPDVKRHFPRAKHLVYLSRKGSLGGQGELKKVLHDPLFGVNHSCAMARYSLSRLIRRTWCTTKRADRLWLHLMIWACGHNRRILEQSASR